MVVNMDYAGEVWYMAGNGYYSIYYSDEKS